jgi:dinuclear metal center YbgI/SA1388 family protein
LRPNDYYKGKVVADLFELERFCSELLNSSSFEDYSPNGLQVDAGTRQVHRVVTGVTASQALIAEAVAWQADLLLVHHGYFWRGETLPLTGYKGRRIRTLMQQGTSLMAYHLPLDAHPELGNNRQLALLLGLDVVEALPETGGLLWWGALSPPLFPEQLAHKIARALDRKPLHISVGDKPIARLCWCTGAAQNYIEKAAAQGMDAYISGEISEQTVHLARELGIHFFAAGHHATERYGIQALGERLSEQFGLEHRFIEVENPV